MTRYVIGVDLAPVGRAVIVDCADGRELATTVYPYRHGVIDQRLPDPDSDVELEPDWALQDPNDYVRTLSETIPAVLDKAGVRADEVIGVGIDFTACTMLPTRRRRDAPLLPAGVRRDPHAWVKLWKHHAAQPEADGSTRPRPTQARNGCRATAARSPRSGSSQRRSRSSSRRPRSTSAADRLIEAADWVVWQLTGVETPQRCTAGYKAIWSKAEAFRR